MKEKIQPYTIEGKGIATEAKVEVQSRFTTQDKAVIYYDLRDTTQTSTVRRLSDGAILTLPYKVLSYQKIIVTGNDRAAAISDTSLASNIVFRERTDIIKDSADTNTYRYFAVRNKMTQRGRTGGRQTVDRGAYRLYEKPSASQTGLNNYTFLSESLGEPVDRIPVYGPKGDLIGYEDKYLTSNYGAGIIDIQVTIPTSGQPTYTVASNSRGDNFYINLVQPYL